MNQVGRKSKAVILVAMTLGLLGAGYAWIRLSAEAKLVELNASWRKEVQQERDRGRDARAAVLHGAPLDENAAPRYYKILAEARDLKYSAEEEKQISLLLRQTPGAPVPAGIDALLNKWEATLAAMNDALRCNRCDWAVEYEKGFEAKVPSAKAAIQLSELLLLQAYRRAACGDMRGAAQRCLDLVRFGSDLARGGMLLNTLVGTKLTNDALDLLGRILREGKSDAGMLSQIEKELGALEAGLPNLADGYRREWLTIGAPQNTSAMGTLQLKSAADCLPHYKAILNGMERAAKAPSARERDEILKETQAHVNFLMTQDGALAVPAYKPAQRAADGMAARIGMIRIAVATEKLRLALRDASPKSVGAHETSK